MTLALYGILIILALFIVLMVFNPNLSCFGRKLKSPFYPMIRKKKMKQKTREIVDYGFDLGGSGEKRAQAASMREQAVKKASGAKPDIAIEDYGFDLGGKSKEKNSG
jgi:hypothetical protein